MKSTSIVLVILAAIAVQSCGKKPAAAKITEWQQFQDPYFKVTFVYPKAWHVVTEPNKISIYTTQEAAGKFFDPTSKNPEGAQIVVGAERDSMNDLSKYVEGFKSEKAAEGYEVKSAAVKSLEGVAGMQIEYAGRFEGGAKLGILRTMALKDSMMYFVHYGAFGDFYDANKVVYDSVIASLTLPKPRVVAKNVDPSLPVPETDRFQNEVLDVTYPANFGPSIKKVSGEVEFAMELKAYRQDATINIDKRPAKKNTLDKLVEQNSKNFKGVSSKGSATISGEKAVYLNYQPTKGVDGRVYFLVKNNQFYRVIVFYPSSMKKEFLPPFEKTVASILIK